MTNEVIDRPRAFRDALVEAWQAKTGPTLTDTRGQFTLALSARPEYIWNNEGKIVGVEAWVRLFRNGREINIDQHRRVINPPTYRVTKDATYDAAGTMQAPREKVFDPLACFWTWLWDSVQNNPGVVR